MYLKLENGIWRNTLVCLLGRYRLLHSIALYDLQLSPTHVLTSCI